MNRNPDICCTSVALSEADVLAAMKEIPGYIDISPGDFREIFQIAHAHALRRLQSTLTAADIMTKNVECLRQDLELLDAAALLAGKRYSGAPVLDQDGKVAGVLSEKDFLTRLGLGATASFMQIIALCLQNKGSMEVQLRNHTIGEIMSTPPITAGPEITVTAVSNLFLERQINRLPIVDRDGRPIGIVTRTDIVQSCCITL